MLSLKARGARGLLRNFHPPPRRCLSGTPARARNNPNGNVFGLGGRVRSDLLYQMSPQRREEALAAQAERTGRPRRSGGASGSGGGGRPVNDFKKVRYDEERDNPRFEPRREKKEESRDRTRGGQTSRHEGGRPGRGSPQGGFGRGAQRSLSAPTAPKMFRSERFQGGKPPGYGAEAPNRGGPAGQGGSGRGSGRGARRSSSVPMTPEAFRSEMILGTSMQPGRGVNESPSTSRQRHEPKSQMTKRKEVEDLIPKLSSEHADKINTPRKIYRARSLYFTPPKRPNGRPARSAGDPEPVAKDGGSISASGGRSIAYENARVFFTRPKAQFLYSAASFKHHPINTTTPEVCVIGASNCGKSSFVNGLTGLSGRGMAMEGHQAGKTVTMNAYGIGSLARLPRRAVASPAAAGEKGSAHGAILVDTPGYGYASRKEWGREIVEYLKKRTMLGGVVLLLSAEKRVSAQDESVMRLVAEAGRPAMVVFTKMDKTLARGKRSEQGGIEMRLREVERAFARTGWDGWGPRIHLTAAKMERPKELASETGVAMAAAIPGMAGVRIEILEMIGLREFVAPLDRATMRDLGEEEPDEGEMEAEGEQTTTGEKRVGGGEKGEVSEEKREKPGKAMESDPTAWEGEILSYEELQKKFGDWSS